MEQTTTKENGNRFVMEAIEGIAEHVDMQKAYGNIPEKKAGLKEFVGICLGMRRYISRGEFIEFYGEKVEVAFRTEPSEKLYIRWFTLSPLSIKKQKEVMSEICFEIINEHSWSRFALCPLDCVYDEENEEIGLIYDELLPDEGLPVYKMTKLKYKIKLQLCQAMFDVIAKIHAKGVAFGGMQGYDCRLLQTGKGYELKLTKGLCGQTYEGTVVTPGYACKDMVCPPKWNFLIKKNRFLYDKDDKYREEYDKRIQLRKQYMDIYSIAVISFMLIIGCHPLKGSALYGMGDWQHIQYECYRNPLFIFSPKDTKNRIGYYQSEQIYIKRWESLSDELKELYCMIFDSKIGRLNILGVETIARDWADAFSRLYKAV